MSENSLIALNNSRASLSDDIAQRVRSAVGTMVSQGIAPSFYSVADAAQVARSTLYRRDDLKALIVAARGRVDGKPSGFSAASERIAQLEHENALLRSEVARLTTALEASKVQGAPDVLGDVAASDAAPAGDGRGGVAAAGNVESARSVRSDAVVIGIAHVGSAVPSVASRHRAGVGSPSLAAVGAGRAA